MGNLIKALVLSTLLTGCGVNYYKILPIVYDNEISAATGFYKSNYEVIVGLTTEEELLGYVVKCGNIYKHTNYKVGGLSNPMLFDVDLEEGCIVESALHTHPLPPKGMSVDHFSVADLHLSKKMNVYLFSLENNVLRVARGDQMRYGVKLGTINK